MLVSHKWLQEYLGDKTLTPEKIEELLTFHSFEIDGVEKKGDDTVIDVDILPNRSSDCLCHRGIAREIATLIGAELSHDPFRTQPEMPDTDKVKISIADPTACRHFDLALVSGVAVAESPAWLKERLEAIGQRSINNIVDVTNYVMFSLGQPIHAYDADKFEQKDGSLHFGIRFAKAGEKIKTLTKDEYELTENIQVIVDENSGALAGIAGIKGGAYAEVDSATKNIIIEAGNFDGSITRKASQELRLQTDASKRYENNVSTNVVSYAIAEVVKLVLETAGGVCDGYAHERPVDVVNKEVTMSLVRANALLGVQLEKQEVEDIFTRLGFVFKSETEGEWTVIAPFERTDINIEEDVIEEVGRIYGYHNVTSVVPDTVPLAEYNARHYYSEVVRDALVTLGFSEVITSSFRNKDQIQLLNALASDKSYMRSSLSKNIEETLDKNAGLTDLLGATDTRVFEIGTVFTKTDEGIAEHTALSFGARIKQNGYTGKEDAVIKDAVTALETALGVSLKVNIEKGVAEINFSELIEVLPEVSEYAPIEVAEEIAYKPFSMYPSVSRDIALWVTEGTTVAEVEGVLNATAGDLRVRTTHVDEFTKEGRTSLAFRLIFQSYEKTLTDEEVNAIMEKINAAVEDQKWEVR